MQTVTTMQLRDAFITAICAIVPTAEQLRAIHWAYTPSERVNGRSALPPATRNFDLIFKNTGPTAEWQGGIGSAYRVDLAIAVSYAGVEPELRDHVKAADAVDLRRALLRLIDPTVPGLVDARPLGERNEITDEANAYVEHAFSIAYHQATA